MINPGVIVCSRCDSTRIPNKPWAKIGGKYLISRLIEQIETTGLPLCLAVPEKDFSVYRHNLFDDTSLKHFDFFSGSDLNPLRRTLEAAVINKINPVIRITHDKVFIDKYAIEDALGIFLKGGYDYLYSSDLIDGTGFEIISLDVLAEAVRVFPQDIEHITYAARAVAKNQHKYIPESGHFNKYMPDVRLLIDFREDLDFVRSLYDYSVRSSPDLYAVLQTLERNPFLKEINRQPDITVYTCAYNESSHIMACVDSVFGQTIADKIEYIVVDDHSRDDTYQKLIQSKHYKKIKLIRNETNLGLAASSNVALNMARGKYVLRLDADDMLIFPTTLERMIRTSKVCGYDALYPNYIDQKTNTIQDGNREHHVGGALFNTRAIRNVQFTDHLRGWDGLDLFKRAKDQFDVGYYTEFPAFYYRDKPNSMSKTNPEYRAKIKEKLDAGISGHHLAEMSC